mgnify:CR=1 FL=1
MNKGDLYIKESTYNGNCIEFTIEKVIDWNGSRIYTRIIYSDDPGLIGKTKQIGYFQLGLDYVGFHQFDDASRRYVVKLIFGLRRL